jgi:hypothetical protein
MYRYRCGPVLPTPASLSLGRLGWFLLNPSAATLSSHSGNPSPRRKLQGEALAVDGGDRSGPSRRLSRVCVRRVVVVVLRLAGSRRCAALRHPAVDGGSRWWAQAMPCSGDAVSLAATGARSGPSLGLIWATRLAGWRRCEGKIAGAVVRLGTRLPAAVDQEGPIWVLGLDLGPFCPMRAAT